MHLSRWEMMVGWTEDMTVEKGEEVGFEGYFIHSLYSVQQCLVGAG